MKKYKDVFEGMVAEVKETPKEKNFLASAKIQWGKSDERNKNGRLYSDLVVAPAILKFNKEAQAGAGKIGSLDHPVGTSNTLLSNASHLVNKVWADEKKQWWADVKIMNTSKGRDLLAVLRTGSKIGASLRAYGEVDKKGDVLPGIEFKAIDFVSSASFGSSATVDQSAIVFESFIPSENEEDGWDEKDIEKISNALDGLSDKTIKLIQERLQKSEGIVMTEERIQGLILWIKHSKNNPNILPFHEWFLDMQEKLGIKSSNFQEELNDGLRKKASLKTEKRIAGFSFGVDKLRLEQRQKNIDEAFRGKRMSTKTVSRLFAEAVLAGYKGSRADWIKEFGW